MLQAYSESIVLVNVQRVYFFFFFVYLPIAACYRFPFRWSSCRGGKTQLLGTKFVCGLCFTCDQFNRKTALGHIKSQASDTIEYIIIEYAHEFRLFMNTFELIIIE